MEESVGRKLPCFATVLTVESPLCKSCASNGSAYTASKNWNDFDFDVLNTLKQKMNSQFWSVSKLTKSMWQLVIPPFSICPYFEANIEVSGQWLLELIQTGFSTGAFQ